jgi:DNA-binding NtrC family response regulator
MAARILIVDDEQDILNMLSRHFSFKGYEVGTARGAIEALSLLEAQRFEVVISDVCMPGINGVDLLKIIRNQFPMTHVIMMTGQVSLDTALACMRRGADTCIFKPFSDLRELEEAVELAISDLKRWQDKFLALKAMGSFEQQA